MTTGAKHRWVCAAIALVLGACGHSSSMRMQNESFLHTPISQTAEPEWVLGPGRWAHLRIGYTPSSIDFPGQPRIATLPLTNSDNEQTVATYRVVLESTIVTLPWPTYDARDNALTLCASALERERPMQAARSPRLFIAARFRSMDLTVVSFRRTCNEVDGGLVAR